MSVLQLVTNFTPKCLRCRKVSDSSAPFPASSDTAALPSLLQLPSSQLCWMLLRGDREAFTSLVQLGRASAGGYKALLTELLPCPAESHRDSPEEEGTEDQNPVLPHVTAARGGAGTTNPIPIHPAGPGGSSTAGRSPATRISSSWQLGGEGSQVEFTLPFLLPEKRV